MALEFTNKGAALSCDEKQNHNPESLQNHGQSAPKRPYPDDDVANASIYSVAQEIDRILHRQSVSDHAAILGLIQVTVQKRMHAHQERQAKLTQEAQQELQRRNQFGITQ